MNRHARIACCLLVSLLCLPAMSQSQGDSKKTDGVTTIEEMEERLANVESDGSVITTDKMKERLEGAPQGRAVITNSTLSADETTATPGAFTNEDLDLTDESENENVDDVDGMAADAESVSTDEADDAEPDAERQRLIGEIESELDALAVRVQDLQEGADDARLRETESKIEELRRAVDSLKQGE